MPERSRRHPEDPDAGASFFVFDRAGVREVDRLAVEEYGVPSIVLMENAARNAAEVALDMLEELERARVLVVCGPGNNGGDGLAMARHLHNAGLEVLIALAADPSRLGGDPATNLGVVRRMGLPVRAIPEGADGEAWLAGEVRGWERADLVVDALLGTGQDRPAREPVAGVIRAVNGARADGVPVLSVDVPSGLDVDTGRPLGEAVRASATVTFIGLKAGFTTLEAQAYLGDVVVVDIGAPRELAERLGRRVEARPFREEPPEEHAEGTRAAPRPGGRGPRGPGAGTGD